MYRKIIQSIKSFFNPQPLSTQEKEVQQIWKDIARIKNMSPFSLVGEILARAQLIEELMRMYIAEQSGHKNPRAVKGTFGVLKGKFIALYKGEKDLLEQLNIANDVRNEIAHDTFLVTWFLEDLLKDSNKAHVDHFNHKTLEKNLYAIQDALTIFIVFYKNNPLTTNSDKSG